MTLTAKNTSSSTPKKISFCWTAESFFAVCMYMYRYWHRSLNPRKLIEVKFSHLSRNMTMQRTMKLYRLPEVCVINLNINLTINLERTESLSRKRLLYKTLFCYRFISLPHCSGHLMIKVWKWYNKLLLKWYFEFILSLL